MEFTDSHINAVAKAYYCDEHFSRGNDSAIDLWRVYNLFTGANKSSYSDTFLDVDRPRERSFFRNQAIRESRFESRLYRIICFHVKWDRV